MPLRQVKPASTGPTTETGKQTVSGNAQRHGLLAQRAVLAGESHEDFLHLLNSLYEEHQPTTPTEESIVQNLAVVRWRQFRLWTIETAGLDDRVSNPHPRYANTADPFSTSLWFAFRTLTDETRSLELLNRYDARFEREFRHNLKALRDMRAHRKTKSGKKNKDESEEEPKQWNLWWVGDDGSEFAGGAREPTPEELALFGKFTWEDWEKWEANKKKDDT
jgi:hypothetical protein